MDQATKAEQMPESTYESEKPQGSPLLRLLIWAGIAGLSTALAYSAVRRFAGRRAVDPTTQRIQQLIDEANQLLKTLDEQKRPS